ncbi:hypothetical protein PG994_013439 [Apiospora phragmitis]|uniref:Cytochrome P450 n=1 Tax=Apiospora phragmitis TaxID=2905665 RepID=A0ABR1T8N2_9PEZI
MLWPLVAAAVALMVTFSYRKVQFMRFRQHATLPQHPTSLILGHLKVFGDYVKRNRPDAHPDMAIVAMSQALGRPPLMFVDLRPISQPMVVVGDHDIADQLTKATPTFPTSPPKSSQSLDRIQYVMGPTSIFSAHSHGGNVRPTPHFLFAGHDATVTLLSWALYELSRTPHALRTVRTELDTLLGSDASPAAVRAILLERTDLLQQMDYLAAKRCVCTPPDGTARAIPPGSGFTVRMPDGQQQCLDGLLNLIHTDPNTFGRTAGDFVPERWLLSAGPGSSVPPAEAWCAFERGPRNCIGQELANIEARGILALAARRFDFCKVGLGAVIRDESGRPRLDANKKGQYQVGEELYSVRLS